MEVGPIICAAIFIGVIVLVIVIAVRRDRKRRLGWQELAGRLGYAYVQEDQDLPGKFPFQLFSCGTRQTAHNVLAGEKKGVSIILADFEFSTPAGDRSHKETQTVCVVSVTGLNLPSMIVVREAHLEGAAGRLGSLLNSALGGTGPEDIDFDDDPAFSEAFILLSPDQAQARQAFNTSVRWFFVKNQDHFPKCTIETSGNSILIIASCSPLGYPSNMQMPASAVVSTCGIRIPPEESTTLMELGLRLVEQWRH